MLSDIDTTKTHEFTRSSLFCIALIPAFASLFFQIHSEHALPLTPPLNAVSATTAVWWGRERQRQSWWHWRKAVAADVTVLIH